MSTVKTLHVRVLSLSGVLNLSATEKVKLLINIGYSKEQAIREVLWDLCEFLSLDQEVGK